MPWDAMIWSPPTEISGASRPLIVKRLPVTRRLQPGLEGNIKNRLFVLKQPPKRHQPRFMICQPWTGHLLPPTRRWWTAVCIIRRWISPSSINGWSISRLRVSGSFWKIRNLPISHLPGKCKQIAAIGKNQKYTIRNSWDMFYLVCFDIVDNRKRYRVVKILKNTVRGFKNPYLNARILPKSNSLNWSIELKIPLPRLSDTAWTFSIVNGVEP